MITPAYGLTATERVLPSFVLDWTTGLAQDAVNVTRAGVATYVDANGDLQTALADTQRVDFSTGIAGILVEEARTNNVANNTMQGAVAGSPGTLPTGWAVLGSGGLTVEVLGVGTENGVSYVDLRFVGTTTATELNMTWQNGGVVAASQNQVWTSSYYIKLVGGSLSNITTIRQLIIGTNSGGGFLSANSFAVVPTNASLLSQRAVGSATMTNALTAFVFPRFDLLFSSGVAIDVTLRFGMPQLELGAFATSVIPTEASAVTRNADVASVTGTNFSDWFNPTEGAFYVEGSSASASTLTLLSVNNGGLTERIDIRRRNTNNLSLIAVDNNVVVVDIANGSGWGINTANSGCIAYKADNVGASLNGAAVSTDTSATLPTVDRMNVGSTGGGVGQLNGYVQKIMYWPQRITNAEIQAFSK